MPAIANVTRRGGTYWWRRRLRFVAAAHHPITVVTTISLRTKEQAAARRRGAALNERSEGLRVSLYERIEREGLTAEQAARIFQDEMVRYRNMLAYQHSSVQTDGEGDVDGRVSQMMAIYQAVNSDFVANGFTDYLGIDYVGDFDKRFAMLDEEARENLYAMLAPAGDLPGHLLDEARDLLRRLAIPATGERPELARRIMCEARATAAATYADPAMNSSIATISTLAALGQSALMTAFGAREAQSKTRRGPPK